MRVTAVGDCGVDRYLNLGRDRPGGITLNFAANARRLFPASDAVGVVTALGTDREAGLVRRAIAALGVEACLSELEGATSIQYIERHPSGREDLRSLSDSSASPRARTRSSTSWRGSPGATGDSSS